MLFCVISVAKLLHQLWQYSLTSRGPSSTNHIHLASSQISGSNNIRFQTGHKVPNPVPILDLLYTSTENLLSRCSKNTVPSMAPRKKASKQSCSDENNSYSIENRSSVKVSNYETEIKAIEKEMKMSKRRLEKTITNLQLQVVTYKTNLGLEMLRTNLYDLLLNDNNAGVVLNPIDNYLDFEPKSKALHNETRKTRNETNSESCTTINNDRRKRRTKSMSNRKTSYNENDEEIVGNCRRITNKNMEDVRNKVVDKNIEIVTNKNIEQIVQSANWPVAGSANIDKALAGEVQRGESSDLIRKELEDVKKGDETIKNDKRRAETSDLRYTENMVQDTVKCLTMDKLDKNEKNETKSCSMDVNITDSEQRSAVASLLINSDNKVIERKVKKTPPEKETVKETQFIFQAFIEENNLATPVPTNIPLLETKDGDPISGHIKKDGDSISNDNIQKFTNKSKIEQWMEKVDRFQNSRRTLNDQEHDHAKRLNSNEKQIMKTPLQTLYVIPRTTQRANIPGSAQSNLIDSNISTVKTQNNLPSTTNFGKQNSHRNINMKTQNTQSNTKSNILRPSKLDNSLNKMSNPLIGTSTNGIVKDISGCKMSGNSQKPLDNIRITKGRTNIYGTFGKINANGVISTRSSTPCKENQKAQSEQRGPFGSQSKIPKYLSPLTKTPNRNGQRKLESNWVTSTKPASVIKRRPEVPGIQPCLRGNSRVTLKNNVKENIHAFKNMSGIQSKNATGIKSVDVIGKQVSSKLMGNNGQRPVVPKEKRVSESRTMVKKMVNKVNVVAAVAEPQTNNNEDVSNQNEKLNSSVDELRIQESRNEIPTQNTLKEMAFAKINQSLNLTTLKKQPTLTTTQNNGVSQILSMRNSPEHFAGSEDEPFIDTAGNLNKTQTTFNSPQEITDKAYNELASISHEISDKACDNVETNDIRKTLSPLLTKINANQTQTTLTVPNDLYTFRDSIVSDRKPIDFIQRNKERIKTLTRKKTSKSKKRMGTFKQFKDSIVIDSRYLMIVNRMLQENRKCATCRGERNKIERNKRCGPMGRGKLNQPKESSTHAKGPDQHIFVKFTNFQQLNTVLSKINEHPGANNTSKESSIKTGESSSFNSTEKTPFKLTKREKPERNEVTFSSPTTESNTDEQEERLDARNRIMSSLDRRYKKRRTLSENRNLKEQLPSETRDGKRRASSENIYRKIHSSNESLRESDPENDLSSTLTDFTITSSISFPSSHRNSPSSHTSSPTFHKSRNHRDSIEIVQKIPIKMKTRRGTARTSDSENEKSNMLSRHAVNSSQSGRSHSQISRENFPGSSRIMSREVSQERLVKNKSNTDISSGSSESNKCAISQRKKLGEVSQSLECVSKISLQDSSASFQLGGKCPDRNKETLIEQVRKFFNREISLENKSKNFFDNGTKVNMGDNIQVLNTEEKYCQEIVDLDSTLSFLQPCSYNTQDHLPNHENLSNSISFNTIDKFNISPLNKSDKVYEVDNSAEPVAINNQMKSKPNKGTRKKSTSPAAIVTKSTSSKSTYSTLSTESSIMKCSESCSINNQSKILSNLKKEPIKQEIQGCGDSSNEHTMLGDDSVLFLSEIKPKTNQDGGPKNTIEQEIKLEITAMDNEQDIEFSLPMLSMKEEQDNVNINPDMELSLPILNNMKEYNSIEYSETKMTNDINITRVRPFNLVPLDNLLSLRVKRTLNSNSTIVNQPIDTFIDDHIIEPNNKIDLETTVHLNEITNEFELGNQSNKTNESIHVQGKVSDESHHSEIRNTRRFGNESTSVKMLLDNENVDRNEDGLSNETDSSDIDMKPFESPNKTEFEKSIDDAFTSTKYNISNVTRHGQSTSKHCKSSQNNLEKTFDETHKTPKIPAKKSTKTPNRSVNTLIKSSKTVGNTNKTPRVCANTSSKTPVCVFGNTFNKTPRICANTSNETPKICANKNKTAQSPKRAVKNGSVRNSSKVVDSSSKSSLNIKNTSANISSQEVKNSKRTPVPTPRRTVQSFKTPEFVSSTPFKPLQPVCVIKEEPFY